MVAARSAPALALALLLAGCSVATPGQPEPAPAPPTTSKPAPPRPGFGAYRQADCLAVVDNAYRKVDCTQPHQAEVVSSDPPPPGAGEDHPPSDHLVAAGCRDNLARYMGGADVPATRMESDVLWPPKESWNVGDRWYACIVRERGPDNKAARRTGSVEGALANGLGALQRCYVGDPMAEPVQVVPCDQPHRSEAVPGVFSLGSHRDPPPPLNVTGPRSADHCQKMIERYLGGPPKPGIDWRSVLPHQDFWYFGATNAVCYVISDKPVTAPIGK